MGMDRTFKRIIFTGLLFIAIAGGAVALVLSGGCSSALPGQLGVLDGVRSNVVNTLIDVSGVKGRIDSELRARSGALADELGVSQSVAEDLVDALAIQDWRATVLPDNVQATSTSTVDAQGNEISITTYDDPSFVTLGAFGLSVTMQAPESAQTYTPFLEYLQYLQ